MNLQLQFIPTKDDYITCTKEMITSPRLGIVITIFLFILEILLGNWALSEPEIQTRADWSTPLFLPVLGVLLAFMFLPLLPYLLTRGLAKHVDKNPILRSQINWNIGGDELIVKNEYAETKYQWSVFSKAIEMKDYYLLYYSVNKNCNLFIPKRAFTTNDDEKQFREIVNIKIGKIQSIDIYKKLKITVINILGVIITIIIAIYYWRLLFIEIFRYR